MLCLHMVTLTCNCMKRRHVGIRGIIKFIRIYYNTNSRGFGKFFMDFFTRLTRFFNFERRFSNLEAVLYMTMTAAYSKSART